MKNRSNLLLVLLFLWNLLLLLQILVLKGKTLVILSAFLSPLTVQTLHIQMPTIPFLNTTTVQEDLLLLRLLVLLVLEDNWRLYPSVQQVIEIYISEERVVFNLFCILFEP